MVLVDRMEVPSGQFESTDSDTKSTLSDSRLTTKITITYALLTIITGNFKINQTVHVYVCVLAYFLR